MSWRGLTERPPEPALQRVAPLPVAGVPLPRPAAGPPTIRIRECGEVHDRVLGDERARHDAFANYAHVPPQADRRVVVEGAGEDPLDERVSIAAG